MKIRPSDNSLIITDSNKENEKKEINVSVYTTPDNDNEKGIREKIKGIEFIVLRDRKNYDTGKEELEVVLFTNPFLKPNKRLRTLRAINKTERRKKSKPKP